MDVVEAACHNYGLSPRRLMLEVTETAMLVETELALANAHALLNSGTRLALDDFCTGHSALARLQSFPLDRLKIDRAFVSALAPGKAAGRCATRPSPSSARLASACQRGRAGGTG